MASGNRVVVVGSGAAGLAAAVGAATSGAQVTVLEAAGRLGGTTATSGGGLWIPVNPWAAAHGVEDSVEEAVRYLTALQGGEPGVAEAFVREGLRIVRLAEERTPLRWQHLIEFPDYHAELDGGSAHGRSLEMMPVQISREAAALVRDDPYGLPPITINEGELPNPPDSAEIERREREGIMVRGRGLVAALAATLLEHGGEIRTGMRATRLLASGGAVVGVEAGAEEFRGEVVLASGGFERNAALVRAFLRGPMLGPAGPPSNRGDALLMGMQVGAALANMSDAWWVAALGVPGEVIDGAPFHRMLFNESARPGGLVVDQNGRRFVNEAVNYYGFARALQERDGSTYRYSRVPSWLILDATRRREPLGPLTGAEPDPDWLAKAQTLEDLAARIDVPQDALDKTVATFNEGAAAGVDPDFGRGSFIWDYFSSGGKPLRPLSEPPFYALRLVPGCSGTKGGLEIDENGRVRRLGGEDVVPGLYAAGNAAAYVFGSGYPGPGATIGPGLVFGWRAGETAAAETS